MKATKEQADEYKRLVMRRSPRPAVLRNALWAFGVGGTICAVGQFFLNLALLGGLPLTEAVSLVAGVMIAIGAGLTGLGVYDRIGKRAGMGAALPITGFANSIASAAMDFRREGLLLGVGARLFTIAGPVIVYALAAGLVVAIIRMLVAGPAGS
ncbi:MAG TPA: stage V sporulation protein AC [Clostridiales bacterium]|nr:stage V sporulation protein AC [Clostridiales bacterium]